MYFSTSVNFNALFVNRGESTAGSIQPPESVADNISYFCHVSFYTPNYDFQNFVVLPANLPFLMVLMFYLCCFLQTKLWTWVISIYFSVSPVWSRDCERECSTLTFGTLAGSQPQREPSSQQRVFHWRMFWFVLCFPHLLYLERTLDSITPFSWTTRLTQPMSCAFSTPKK